MSATDGTRADAAPSARTPRMVHRAYLRAAGTLRSRPSVYRLLFGHWPARAVRGQLWDWTTLALAKALRRHVRPGMSVLDMGTGPAGVLAVYARHRLRCGRACGVDYVPELLPSAAATAAGCGAGVEFVSGTLFSAVEGTFDVIVFNAPYVPVVHGRRLGVMHDAEAERRWSGGATGLETVEHFLRAAPDHLAPGGCILLGVNHFYVLPDVVRGAVARCGLTVSGTVLHRLTHACAYVLRPLAA
jgi:release factor glutamine methyltransferase